MKPSPRMWKTKAGELISIKELEDGHLLNIIAMLQRYANAQVSAALNNYPNFQGEMAQMCAERDWDALAEDPERSASDILEEIPQWKFLIGEARNRGLKVPT